MSSNVKRIECDVDEIMNQPVVKIYVLKSVMKKMIANNIKFPQNLTDEYKNIPGSSKMKNDVYKSMKKLNKKNEDLITFIGLKYNEYKYVGDEQVSDVKIMMAKENNRLKTLTQSEVVEFMGIKQKAKAFCWNAYFQKLSWLDTKVVQEQFKIFKKSIKNGELKCMEYNNVEHKFNGITWYSLVFQSTTEGEDQIDIGAVVIFRFMVSGFAYHFSKKTNRDAMFAYVNK